MNNQVKEIGNGALSFSNTGWSAIALVSLGIAWWLINYRVNLALKYSNLIHVLVGVILAVSLVSIIVGIWRASFRWKFLTIAIALVWLAPFALYVISFAGPLFSIHLTQ